MKIRNTLLAVIIALAYTSYLSAETNIIEQREYRTEVSKGISEDGGSIVGIEADIQDGCLAGMRDVPLGWVFKIDNQSGMNATVSGLAAHGANSLSAKELDGLFRIRSCGEGDAVPIVKITLLVTQSSGSTKKIVYDNVRLQCEKRNPL